MDEGINDDNSMVALNPQTMETLQLFRGDTVLLKVPRCSIILIDFRACNPFFPIPIIYYIMLMRFSFSLNSLQVHN